jgi:signal transduction histidine kinase
MKTFVGLSLSRRFLITSFPILLLGMLVIGAWVSREVENGVVHRLGGVTGLYVESFISPHVQSLVKIGDLTEADRAALDKLLTNTPLGQRIVAFKLWRPNGQVLYSKDVSMIGRSFPIGEGLEAAFSGNVHSHISDLSQAENESEARNWPQLIETYVPIHAEGLGTVMAVAEFYQTTDELEREAWAAQRKSWLVVAVTVLMMYLLLFGLVHRGSKTIDRQRQELKDKVAQLTALILQNETLHEKVRRAAARTTTLNERFLRQIAADLHDGPGQDMGFALMQVEALADTCSGCPGRNSQQFSGTSGFNPVRSALQSALTDLRAISAGLRLPDIDQLSIDEIAARTVRDYEGKTGARVAQKIAGGIDASLSVKITLYRLLQEALANGFLHASGSGQQVEVKEVNGCLIIEVTDSGSGFDPTAAMKAGRHGLAGMQERVEILGGSFDLVSAPSQGTLIRVSLPLIMSGVEHE